MGSFRADDDPHLAVYHDGRRHNTSGYYCTGTGHLVDGKQAVVYVRQYALTERAVGLGWSAESVRIIDADLGRSGASTTGRSGFAELTTMVGLGQVQIEGQLM